MIKPLQSKPVSALLGLALGPHHIEGAEVRRSNGSVEIRNPVSHELSLHLLSQEPELVGREIRKLLDAAGIRERRCAVCLPSAWILSHQVPLPALEGADLDSFILLEAERAFPYAPEDLVVATSKFKTPSGQSFIEVLAVPRDSVRRLEAVLTAARLKPVTFSLATAALQPADAPHADGTLAMLREGTGVSIQVTHGGGITLLRTLELGEQTQDSPLGLDPDAFLRDLRITLGQLPPELRESVHRARIFGRDDAAVALAETVQRRAAAWNLRVDPVRDFAPGEFPVKVPSGTAVSAAVGLAIRQLTGHRSALEFLPPKVSAWRRLNDRYASRRLGWIGFAAAATAGVVACAFLIQQIALWRWTQRWDAIAPRVTQLDDMQQRIRRYRPWFDESQRALTILRRVTEAFPEDDSLAAKTFEIRPPATVLCSGTARDRAALLKALDKLRAAKEVSDVKVEQMRGKSPLEFTFHFQWGDRPTP